MPTVAQVIVDHLHAAGVRTVFGLPGGETVEILEALRQAEIRFVLVHNESSALFMADAHARLTGVPGVCLTTLGPGATNATMGLAHAYLDRAPVLLITAQKPDPLLPDYTHQVVDLQRIFAPITKASYKLGPGNVHRMMDKALELVRADRPGPVHLQISNEDAIQQTSPAPHHAPVQTATPPIVPAAEIHEARGTLAAAKRPIIVAGLGLEPDAPYAALRALAESLNAPVIVTPKAKGALSEDHPLFAGTIGLTRTDPAYAVLNDADCVVAVGFDVVELVLPWQHTAPLIWIAPWENEDPVVPSVLEFVGPLTPVLEQLADGDYTSAPDWGATRVEDFRAATAPGALPQPAANRILPQTVLDGMRRALPAQTFLAVDVGSHKVHSSLDWSARHPNRFHLSNGLSGMSFALPAAIGAALALPDQPAVCLTGDAGLAMVLGELGILAREQLPVICIVLNDGAIDLIRSHQVRVGKPVFGTEFDSPNYAQIAAAFGLPNHRVQSDSELDTALQSALEQGGPCLIEVMLDPSSYPTTPKPA
ncbi:MAG: thiamine pyrophosphate-binding protein [Litorilinea sp.]